MQKIKVLKPRVFRILFIDNTDTVISETKQQFYCIRDARKYATHLKNNTKNHNLKNIIAVR